MSRTHNPHMRTGPDRGDEVVRLPAPLEQQLEEIVIDRYGRCSAR